MSVSEESCDDQTTLKYCMNDDGTETAGPNNRSHNISKFMLFSPIRRLFSVSRSSSNNIAYQKPNTADVVVIGGGVIGLACARELNKRSVLHTRPLSLRPSRLPLIPVCLSVFITRLGGGKKKVIVLEKESISTMHASGRNSGSVPMPLSLPHAVDSGDMCIGGNETPHACMSYLFQSHCI